ncbi:transcriptional regulator [Methylobacterium sp. E-045]|uniref:transcriptional regulator n=1 Tax=Methylobacterium sp. E-045 TaxID=2836575 RepID=UPI001FB8FF5B|nr:Cro/CI family transcriptional regulator [Methylobacterium sp. E-045]MCJ2127993.1 helix-turn-helix domain-containing protein [Methylobacterium sp. E-045]
MSQRDDALLRAIHAAGSARALAKSLGISDQALSQWVRTPALRVLDVERISKISRHDLRPDIYGATPPVYVPAQIADQRAGA